MRHFIRDPLIVIALAFALLLFAGAGWVLYRDAHTQCAFTMTGQGQEVASAATTLESSAIVIDIEGQVNSPGVYKLPENARVEAAIEAAGGATDEAALECLTMSRAAMLQDGMRIVVPKQSECGQAAVSVGSVSSGGASCVSINQAGSSELDALEGIGEVRVNKIISGRPYTKLNELVTRKILPQSTYSAIEKQLCL